MAQPNTAAESSANAGARVHAADLTTEDKRFSTLAAQYALAGHSLVRAGAEDGQAPYYCARWGWIRPVHSLDYAEQLLEQITGKK